MKLQIRWEGNNKFTLTEKEDIILAEKRLIIGRVYTADLKTKRNLRAHNKYWLFLEAVAFHLCGTAATWHEWLKTRFMNPQLIVLKNRFVVELPKSEAFNRCTEIEFTDYFAKVQDWFVEQGYDPDILINEMEMRKAQA